MQLKRHGFTLIEIMIALVINTLLFGALITVFVSNLEYYRKTINFNRLNEQLLASMNVMSDEIRRAGYWVNAQNDIATGQNNNPFMASGIDISTNVSNNCILFAYDRDSNGTLPTISTSYDDERYGFRLSGGAIQTRPPGAGFTCVASGWENMTDPNVITITALSFTITSQQITTGPGTTGIVVRSVAISVTGQLVSDTSITKTITGTVRLRNDKFIP